MELHSPLILLVWFPVLLFLVAICIVRRYRKKLERDKEWGKTKKKYRYKDWRY
jgi:hypothetical protein